MWLEKYDTIKDEPFLACSYVANNTRLLTHLTKGWQLMISGVQNALVSSWYPLDILEIRQMDSVGTWLFSRFFKKFFILWPLFTDIWIIFRYTQQIFFYILPKSVRYFIEIWSIFSWKPFIVVPLWYLDDILDILISGEQISSKLLLLASHWWFIPHWWWAATYFGAPAPKRALAASCLLPYKHQPLGTGHTFPKMQRPFIYYVRFIMTSAT